MKLTGKTKLLERASKHYFTLGLGDGASYLCRENMKYGIAKIHIAQEKLGFKPDATFLSTPDETVTRNKTRWKAGFGYGGKLVWGSGKEHFIVLDTKPNACGMLVGGLDELPNPKSLIEKITSYKNECYIDNIKLDWDFAESNHFIDLFEVESLKLDYNFPKYVFIIHGAVPELCGKNEKGVGLYFDKSPKLQNISENIKTDFGCLNVLIDNAAKEYYDFYKYAEQFSKKKRSLVGELLFGKYQEICNITHQGLLSYNELVLGCHNTKDSSTVFPMALKADLPGFLFEGNENISDEIIEVSGFSKRAESLGVTDRLRGSNVLPHGGGYSFSDFLKVKEVIEIGDSRYFILEMRAEIGNKICSDVRDMEFDYRGKAVVLRTVELQLGQIVAKLIPKFVLKI
jgi:hypothetical protein